MTKPKTRPKTRVLIIQAGRAWTARIKEKLGRDDYSFVSKDKLADAVELVGKRPFDVILFDAGLVAAGCKEGCVKIDAIAPGLPKIVLAMTGEEAMKAKASCEKAQEYLAWNHTGKKLLQRSIRRVIECREREQTLRREHDFNAAIFDNLGGVAAVFDMKGRFVRVNRAFGNVLGYSQDEILGKSAKSFLARKCDIETTAECLNEMASNGVSRNCETLWKTKKSGRRLISWSHSPLMDNVGKICNVVCTGIDITEQKRAEDALRESEERFFKAFNSSPDLIAITSPKNGVHYDVNETWLETLGYERDEVIGKTVRELDLWADPKDWALIVGKVKKAKSANNIEIRLRSRDGNIGDYLISFETIELNGKQRLLWVGNDLSERKKTETALRESEELFSKVFFGNPAAVAIVGIDDDRLYEINRNWLKIFGYRREEVFLRTPIELGMWVDLDRRTIFKNRILEKGLVRNFESRLRTNKGKERDFLISGEKMTIAGEEFILTITTDITEMKKTEAALRESEERFSKAFNTNPGLIIIVDAETGKHIDVNKTFLSTMGFSRREVIGRTSLELKLWRDPKKRNALVKALRKDGFIHNYEKHLRTKKGEEKYFLFSGEAIELGGRSCFILAGVDITERNKARKALKKAHDEMEVRVIERTRQLQEVIEEYKQTAQSLRKATEMAEEASRTKTRFLANMSHELRTPLNAILGFSGAMNEEVFGPIGNDKYESYIGNIMESGRHLLELIEDVLDMSKIEAMAMDLNEKSIDIPKAVATSINFIIPLADGKDITVKSAINGALPEIMADPLRVRQILINLLSNAVKFTPNGGKVSVDAKLDADGRMVLSVTDTGIGMAAADIPEALSEFGQLDSTLAEDGQGTGLGLPLSQRLMHLHGGSLVIESREGEGTRVDVIFPKNRVLS
jgi:PAS domain S-box-containing protein